MQAHPNKPGLTFKYSDEININYEKEGNGELALIFIHGFGASLHSWDDIRDFFSAQDATLNFVDLKGFGLSSKPRDDRYSLINQSAIISAFIAQEKLNQVVLVGHSYGGGVALLTYLDSLDNKPEGVIKKLILIDCAAYLEQVPFFLQYLRIPVVNYSLMTFFPARFRAAYTLNHLFFDKASVTEERIERYAAFYRDNETKHSFIATANQIIPDNYREIVDRYQSIRVPTLIIWGRNDPALSIDNGLRLHRSIPGSRFEPIDHCGHVPQEEKPQETYQIIHNFLKGA